MPIAHSIVRRLLILSLAPLAMAACGKKGPLYLPQASTAVVISATIPSPSIDPYRR